MKWFDNTALTLVIIGAANWLLVGIFRFDLVAFLFGNLSWFARIIYTIVGLCGLFLIRPRGDDRGQAPIIIVRMPVSASYHCIIIPYRSLPSQRISEGFPHCSDCII